MKQQLFRVTFAVIPVLISLAVTSLLVIGVGESPIEVFEKLYEGAFRNTESVAGVVNFWIPLALACMGLIITFTAGLWNIGVEGQIMTGALFASWAARTIQLPPELLVPLELVIAALGGVLWGFVIGVLKTRFGVHEIFGGVGLNALVSVFAIYLISGPWRQPEGGNAQSTEPFPASSLLNPMSDAFPVSLLALLITFAAILVVIWILRGTRWGLNLKATGKNPRSALLLGVPTTRSTLGAFMACGVLAGLAGAYRVLFTYDSLRPNVSGGIGFLGLLVVLLVGIRPLWAPIIAFVFAAILAGSTRLRVSLQLDSSLAGVLQGTLVLVVLLFNGLRQRLMERRGAAAPAPAAPAPVVTTSVTGSEGATP
jgi:general nucleoside transport system permease protein